jgi:N utilization substance protein B
LSARRRSRLIAAQALYAYDMGNTRQDLMDGFLAETKIAQKYKEFAVSLFEKTCANLSAIDAEIASKISKEWSLDRLGRMELAVLRLACCEIMFGGSDAPIAINEALDLIKMFADEHAPPFINGVLEAIRKQRISA